MARFKSVIYSVHPAVAYGRSIIDKLPDKTGRSAAQWVKLIKKDGPAATAARRDWLKKIHGVGGTTASMLVDQAEGSGAVDTDPKAYLAAAKGYVEAMYSGPRAGLRSLHDQVVALALGLGKDVKVSPCQTIVPLYRNRVFAQLKPSTRTRLDLGLALKGSRKKPPRRLIDTGGLKKNDRITHRIPLSSPDDIDDQMKNWLEIAYNLDE